MPIMTELKTNLNNGSVKREVSQIATQESTALIPKESVIKERLALAVSNK
ncbi:Uncharacterised protein [Acinetobacter baumannii]|nr:Uncharacterised protein [Acinetobacter baumannii]